MYLLQHIENSQEEALKVAPERWGLGDSGCWHAEWMQLGQIRNRNRRE
jgi:hypothetical protein